MSFSSFLESKYPDYFQNNFSSYNFIFACIDFNVHLTLILNIYLLSLSLLQISSYNQNKF